MSSGSEDNGKLGSTEHFDNRLPCQAIHLLGHLASLIPSPPQLAVVSVSPGKDEVAGSGADSLGVSTSQCHTCHMLPFKSHHLVQQNKTREKLTSEKESIKIGEESFASKRLKNIMGEGMLTSRVKTRYVRKEVGEAGLMSMHKEKAYYGELTKWCGEEGSIT